VRVDDNSSGVLAWGPERHTPDDLRCTVHRMLHVAAQLIVILVDLVARRFTGAFPLEPKKPFLSWSLAAQCTCSQSVSSAGVYCFPRLSISPLYTDVEPRLVLKEHLKWIQRKAIDARPRKKKVAMAQLKKD
jgi:hypothetical protein